MKSKRLRVLTKPYREWLARRIASVPQSNREKWIMERGRVKKRALAIHSCRDFLAMAERAVKEGNHYESVRVLRLATACDPEATAEFARAHPLPELRQDHLMAQAGWGFEEHPRQFHLFRECALLGHFGGKLSDAQREILGGIVRVRQKQWESGQTPKPRASGMAQGVSNASRQKGRLAVVMPKYIRCDPAFIEHDIRHHFGLSATEVGFDVSYFDADSLTYNGSGELERELRRLEDFIVEKKPELMIFDGNFVPNDRTINSGHLLALKKKHGFCFINVIADWYDHMGPSLYRDWAAVSDLTVGFHGYSLSYDESEHDKVLIWPTLPFSRQAFRGPESTNRDLGLSYIGSDSRDRGLFMDLAQRTGLPTYSRIHNRLRREAPGHAELSDIFGRSRVVVNNGWLPNGEDIITARVGETVLSGALLLQELGSPLDDYLVPFVHYAPFTNLHQFVALAQFFLEEEVLRERIARQAHEFWQEHYSAPQFWELALRRIDGAKRALEAVNGASHGHGA